MDCRRCGYIMGPMETHCPRCERLGDTAMTKAAASRRIPLSPGRHTSLPAPGVPGRPVGPRVLPPGIHIPPNQAGMRPHMSVGIADKTPVHSQGVTITTWINLVLYTATFIVIMVLVLGGQSLSGRNGFDTHVMGAVLWFALFICGIKIAVCIGILRKLVWARNALVVGIVLSLLAIFCDGLLGGKFSTSVVRGLLEIPHIVLLVLLIRKWDYFGA